MVKKGKVKFVKIAKGVRFRPLSEEEKERLGIRDLSLPVEKRKIIVHDYNLEDAYKELMLYQPREANVACFAEHIGKGNYNITDIVDITRADTTPGGIDDASVPIGMQDRYVDMNKHYVGQFHSHPSGHAYVSDRDKRCAKRWQNNHLFASITPEGIVSFFGFPKYKIKGNVRKIGKKQYQLDIKKIDKPKNIRKICSESDLEERASKIRFEPISEKEEIELMASQIKFERVE